MILLARTRNNLPEPMYVTARLKMFSDPSLQEEQLFPFDISNVFFDALLGRNGLGEADKRNVPIIYTDFKLENRMNVKGKEKKFN
jgi:hypothetical protein